ncbi:transglutaminase-like cysteine peptidase [Larsenimonas rhizosphaerae]|uniref:Transglutaminase-like cysteine peptidase n=1 Tax=Larsenimonas rhizosphaerae TaxID=2944682 RepID=A0AA41ZEG1_9GAMM|nr:transglutaminase-like cysteine peptidase [Larsenimonas rhizosphaerae]MCX2522629.1 transglutaminase-like cysteine peptidase [Larsenimonas rhizosphaerae]
MPVAVGAEPVLPAKSSIRAVYGNQAVSRVTAWERMMRQAASLSIDKKLRITNDFFNNRAAFKDDIVVWGEEDYWATPVEFLGRGAGDCEDFAMAKYYTLIQLGVPDSRMRLHYVKYIPYDQFHMVLTYQKSATAMPLVLDNIDKNIVPASRRSDLLPVYSFNASNMWLSKLERDGREVGSSSRLSLWQEWLIRMENGVMRRP